MGEDFEVTDDRLDIGALPASPATEAISRAARRAAAGLRTEVVQDGRRVALIVPPDREAAADAGPDS